MSLVAAALAGGVVGAKHALETDHLAAVATLVDGESPPARSGLVGASWGVGHAVPVVLLGLAVVALGVRVPSPVVAVAEAFVGVVLVVLGLRLAADVAGLVDAGLVVHDHEGDTHSHLRLGTFSLGAGHLHLDGDSLAVGALHGLAGSGALVVLVVATAPGLAAALAFLAAFAAGSVVTMALVAAVWSRTLGTPLARPLQGLAALLGVVVGLALLAEVTLGVAPF